MPKAKRELLISVDPGEKRVAVLEDDRVAEVYLERPERRSIAGNIYLGTVDNVLPGMEAAFVEIGLEKNGFLYVDEIVGPELEGRRGARKIQDLIQRGQTVLVQAVKDPMKTKGARLTTEVSLPGRFVVYVPHGEGLGVSRRLEDDERNRLKAILKECAPKTGGVIVRTAAEGASAEDIRRDLDFLERLWKTIEARAKTAKAPALIYQEAELPLRVVRDLFTGDFERLLVDHDRTHKRIVGYLKKTSPHMVERVVRYKEREPLLEALGVEQEIRSTLSRRVDLPSGGYLVFDYAEAFTVIDVNTGRFVGSRSKKSGGRLEDTITKNNLEAVKEVVRQLRLRDIGGIIVIDFIDMANPKNRAAVEEALRTELERDRTKTYVVEISPLGLVEMTRQNVTDGPREMMTKKCPTCGGDGIVISEFTAAVDIERKLRSLVTPGSRAKAFRVEVAAPIAWLLAGPGGTRLRELEELTKRRFYLVGKEGEHLDHFRVLEQGTLENVAPKLPFDAGDVVDVKLVEVGLHDPEAGAGKLDGVEIIVGGAAKLVGKKVHARITVVTDGLAWAELTELIDGAEPPLTAEAEAERPMRARKAVTAKEEPEADDEELEDEDDEEDEDEPTEAVAEKQAPELDADGNPLPPKKKRTRRGSRGGRNRKKKTSTAAGTAPARAPVEVEEAPDAEAGDDAKAEPVIHLPERDLNGAAPDGDHPTPKKRTRRGSRGGRNRKKKTAATTGSAAAAAPVELAEPIADEPVHEREVVPETQPETQPEPEPAREEPSQDGEWGYTPMSEWDFDRGES
ncbi:MAG TPA: Rne/Rng family ribonuclease [Gaiellaceae bacterium]